MALTHDFVPSVRHLLQKLGDDRKALFLILDDINGLASSQDFANWLKSMVDEIATSGVPLKLCLLVVGLEERRQELIALQPSLARVFELIEINPWSDEEANEFYRRSFESASAEVSDEGRGSLVRYTGGLPVLAHEIGDAVWREAKSPKIEWSEILRGISDAAEVIGRKLLEPQVFKAIRSDRYRSILRKMAEEGPLGLGMSLKRAALGARLTGEETRVLDNFLHRMKQLGVLVSDPESRGGVRFPNRLYALYFFFESQRAKLQPHG